MIPSIFHLFFGQTYVKKRNETLNLGKLPQTKLKSKFKAMIGRNSAKLQVHNSKQKQTNKYLEIITKPDSQKTQTNR